MNKDEIMKLTDLNELQLKELLAAYDKCAEVSDNIGKGFAKRKTEKEEIKK